MTAIQDNRTPASIELGGIIKGKDGSFVGLMGIKLNGVSGKFDCVASASILADGTITGAFTAYHLECDEVKASQEAKASTTAIAARLRHLRERYGLKQGQAAKLLSISQSLLSHLENGDKPASISVLMAYREKFGVTIDYLLYGDCPPTPCMSAAMQEEVLRLADEIRKCQS